MFFLFLVLTVPSVSYSETQSQSSTNVKESESMGHSSMENTKFKTFEGEKGNYTIEFPENWDVKKDFMGTDVIALSPQEDSSDMFRENVNIISTELDQPMSKEEYFDLNEKSLEQLLKDFKLADKQMTKVDGVDALKLVYTHRMGDVDAKVLQYLFVNDGKAYVITLTASPEEFDSYMSEFESIVNSFKTQK
jgi:hypothetical protein